jgi:hypothetical protein
MSLLRTSTEGMSPRTRAAHNFFKGQILDDIEAKMAAADAAALAAASAAAALNLGRIESNRTYEAGKCGLC